MGEVTKRAAPTAKIEDGSIPISGKVLTQQFSEVRSPWRELIDTC
jgi:hypothetical protein